MQTLDQQRAAFAWKCVQGQSRDYRNLAKSLPALVMSNGLMQTLTFLKAKEKKVHHAILGAQICAWADLMEKKPKLSGDGAVFCAEFSTIMKKLVEMSPEKYRVATEETLEILRWIRQLADAVIKK